MEDRSGKPDISGEDLVKFAKLAAKVWQDPDFRGRYERDPKAVLKEHGITLREGREGATFPRIPISPPQGDTKEILTNVMAEQFGIKIEDLDPEVLGISVSSLCCVACPVSCFSSVSN